VHWYFATGQCVNNQEQSRPLVTGRIDGVTSDGNGNAAFIIPFDFPPGTSSGIINCTAKDPKDNTSEFSSCLSVNTIPTISINDVSQTEGNSGGTSFTFNVSLSGASSEPVTVNYATADGTATTADGDYSSTGNTLTFDPGQTSKSVTVQVNGDSKFEANESFVVNLTSPTNATLGDGQGQGTILNDDLQPSISINDVSQSEGNSGTTNATFTVSLSAASGQTATVNFATADGTATAPSDYQSTSGTLTFNPGEVSKPITVQVNGDTVNEPAETFLVNLSGAANATIADNQGVGTITNDDATTVQFSATNFNVSEGGAPASVTVSRSGDTSSGATVDYVTSDTSGLNKCNTFNGVANSRCDYIMAVGTLQFAAGENSKTITILIIDDAYAEGNEVLSITLSNATGTTLGSASSATVTINDNDSSTGVNPLATTAFFVHQHYVDFLNREPDAPGLAHWIGTIDDCTPKPGCTEVKRINASAAFFVSIEFKETGYLVYRIYKSAFNNLAGAPVPVALQDFLRDTQRIGQGVVVNAPGWEALLESNKQAFTVAFVQRADFKAAYPDSMTAAEFVDKLNTNAGGALSLSERDAAIAMLGQTASDVSRRAQVVRFVAEDVDLFNAEFRKAFVLMQYFGYLRRNPNDPGFDGQPDPNFNGFNFWLGKLNQFNGDAVAAEMVKGFLDSIEYKERFGP